MVQSSCRCVLMLFHTLCQMCQRIAAILWQMVRECWQTSDKSELCANIAILSEVFVIRMPIIQYIL
jgi:hypothetical protein